MNELAQQQSLPGAQALRPVGESPAATAVEPKPVDLQAPELYLNRELTWLEFNRRVLHEAQDSHVPLLERLKFVAIVSSNLDEFFMKRLGGLKHQASTSSGGE